MKALFLLLCLVSACANLRAADNLLKNPSFEEAGSSEDIAAGWNRWGDWMNRETGWTPTHSGKCLIGYHHWQITSDQNSGIWQDVPNVKAGQKFTFSVFARADVPDGGSNSAQTIELRLEAVHSGQAVEIASVSTPVADIEKGSGWHKLTVTGTTPETNIRALVVVTPASNAPRGASVKIDDASLEVSQ